jgi:hypothetical protein
MQFSGAFYSDTDLKRLLEWKNPNVIITLTDVKIIVIIIQD